MRLKRQEVSDAVSDLGWRLILGELRTQVRTASLAQAAEVAARAVAAADELTAGDNSAGDNGAGDSAGADGAGGHLRLDLRADRVYLSVSTRTADWVTPLDIELTRAISV